MKTLEDNNINAANSATRLTDYGFKEIKVFIGKNTLKGLISASVLTAILVLINCGFKTTSSVGSEEIINPMVINFSGDFIKPKTITVIETKKNNIPEPNIEKIIGGDRIEGKIKLIDSPITPDIPEFGNSGETGSLTHLVGTKPPSDATDAEIEKSKIIIAPTEDLEPEKEKEFEDYEVPFPPIFDNVQLYNLLEYPRLAKEIGIEGRVVINVLINSEGKIEKLVPIDSPSGILTEAAMDSIKKMTFTPARMGNHCVKCWITIPINYILRRK
jgi:TonB family protein